MVDKKADDPEPIDVIVDPREEVVVRVSTTIMFVLLVAELVAGFVVVMSVTPTEEDAVFTAGLVSFSGLNATVGPTVSPAFTLKVHVENPSFVQPWCSNGGEVVVSYSGVALAWGHVPAFCVRRSSLLKLEVLTWGWEVGLSKDLRRHLGSQWRNGTAQISVEMRLFSPDRWTQTDAGGVESLYQFVPITIT
jgi:hypothetical protein